METDTVARTKPDSLYNKIFFICVCAMESSTKLVYPLCKRLNGGCKGRILSMHTKDVHRRI